MPQLDNMLRALAERGARELRLAEGARPVFRYPEGDKPVSQAVLSRAQIVTLVGELTKGHDSASLAGASPTQFEYRTTDGRSYVCETHPAAGAFTARLFLRDSVETAPGAQTRPATAPPSPAAPARKPFTVTAVRPDAPTLDAYLRHMAEVGASDLHLSPEEVPMLRLHGEMVRIEGAEILSASETARLLQQFMPARYREEFAEARDTDFAYEIQGVARFRCNVFADRKGTGAVFRTIPTQIPNVAQLGLSKAILDLCDLPKGLVLVTGPTGSGKSTTLAALVDHVNTRRTDHIITIEDPIEFVHSNKGCLVNQREVGSHTQSFKRALRAALREDPDVVLVGEMRDLETIAIAIETAETGHLVFGTLHTSTAPSTVDRIIDQFPADRQSQIRVMLSESLKGVVSQTLLRKKGGGRVAAMEVLIGIPAVSNLIREGKTFQIPSIMQTGKKYGMVTMNDALVELVKRGLVTPEEAHLKALDKAGFVLALKGAGLEGPKDVPQSP